MDEKLTLHDECTQEIDLLMRANRPIVYVVSHEETRILDVLRTLCVKDGRWWGLMSWDLAAGLKIEHGPTKAPQSHQMDQVEVLDWWDEYGEPADCEFSILVLKDFDKLMGGQLGGNVEKQVVRQLRNLSHSLVGKRKCIVIISPALALPPELSKSCAVIDWPYPERELIRNCLDVLLAAARDKKELRKVFKSTYTDEEMDLIVAAFQGLTLEEIQLLVPYMALRFGRLDAGEIARRKRDIVRKSGVVEWVETSIQLSEVGGLDGVKEWLSARKRCFTPEAHAYGLESPRGLMLLGIQGAGKSMIAKAIASDWQLPLLKMDLGRVYGSHLGISEANIRTALKVAESVAPAILWCDEFEKGLSGSASSNYTDGGTSARVLGTILTWMQEHTSDVFLVATANDISQLPPEILRKGRFDEIFFVDLPGPEERKQIFAIHLAKRRRDPQAFDLNRLSDRSNGFTGAEIEAAVKSAMHESFSGGCELTTNHIIQALSETAPLSVTMAESVANQRAWAKDRTRNASQATTNRFYQTPDKTQHVPKVEQTSEEEL